MKRLTLLLVVVLFGGPWVSGADPSKPGTAKITSPGLSLTLRATYGKGTAGPLNVCTITDAREIAVPAGTYEPLAVHCSARDDKGQAWEVTSRSDFGRLAAIKIAPGETTKLEGGAPLTAQTEVMMDVIGAQAAPSLSKASKVVRVRYQLRGKSGEIYDQCATVGGTTMPKPMVRIVGQDGKVLSEGRLPSRSYTSMRSDAGSIAELIQGFA